MASRNKKKPSTRRAKKDAWFTAVRGSYLPANTAGWLTYIPFVGYLVGSFLVAHHASEKWSVVVLLTIPNWVAAAGVMTYLAAKKS